MPWWYYTAFAAVASAAFVGFFSLPKDWRSVALTAGTLGCIALDRSTRRMRRRATARRIERRSILIGVGTLGLVAAMWAGTWFLVRNQGLTWVVWITGPLFFVLAAGMLALSDRRPARGSAGEPAIAELDAPNREAG
jgi:hypothetical protein